VVHPTVSATVHGATGSCSGIHVASGSCSGVGKCRRRTSSSTGGTGFILYSINPVIYIINVRVVPEGKGVIGDVLKGIINTIGLGVVVEPPVLVQPVGFIESPEQPG